jgi:outer membrane protein TolC
MNAFYHRSWCAPAILLLALDPMTRAGETVGEKRAGISRIDLPTVLRLAHARNLDIQIARERLTEAQANREAAMWQAIPWVSLGVTYLNHKNLIQGVQGDVVEANKESYLAGPTTYLQLDVGDTLYKSLVTHQLVRAAKYAVAAQTQDSVFAAVQSYFDLLKAQELTVIARESVDISQRYQSETHHAVEAGIAFRVDELRVQVQTERNNLSLLQAQQNERTAATLLAQVLHLDPAVRLVATNSDMTPLAIIRDFRSLGALIAQALIARPELGQTNALVESANYTKKGATIGPLLPTVGGHAFTGHLGGDSDFAPSRSGGSQDYAVSLGWRIGPGGLFDMPRIQAAGARFRGARLTAEKTRDDVIGQVVDAQTLVVSLRSQIDQAQLALQAAEETLKLSEERKEFAVGNVLETVQAEQDLTRARSDYANAVAEYNKAQYALTRAVGGLK